MKEQILQIIMARENLLPESRETVIQEIMKIKGKELTRSLCELLLDMDEEIAMYKKFKASYELSNGKPIER